MFTGSMKVVELRQSEFENSRGTEPMCVIFSCLNQSRTPCVLGILGISLVILLGGREAGLKCF